MLTNHVDEDKSRGINEIANATVFPGETGSMIAAGGAWIVSADPTAA